VPDDRAPTDGDDALDQPPLSARLRAGAALFDAGRYRAAAAAWREPSPPDSDDEALFRGLAGYATTIARAGERDWSGATAAAATARARLDGCPGVARGVRLRPIRADLAALARDPVRVERGPPAPVVTDGDVPRLDALTFPAAGLAARALAATIDDEGETDDAAAGGPGRDHRATVERAVAYAARDLADGATGSPFPGLVLDYLTSPGGVVLDRLSALVDRRARREADVDGLFEG